MSLCLLFPCLCYVHTLASTQSRSDGFYLTDELSVCSISSVSAYVLI